MNRRWLLAAPLALAAARAAAQPASAVDAAAIVRGQAQKLYDAVATGGFDVWRATLHDAIIFTDEDGAVSDKTKLLAALGPLPAGVSGTITVTDFQSHRTGPILAATYVCDEHETFHGHALHCQYRVTDTWLETDGGWKLLVSQTQALRTDPPAITLASEDCDACVGRYRLSEDVSYVVQHTPDGLQGQQTGGTARALKAEARDVFFNPGRPRYRWLFQRDGGGRVVRLVERREAWDLVWTRDS